MKIQKIVLLLIISANLAGCRAVSEQLSSSTEVKLDAAIHRIERQLDIETRQTQVEADGMQQLVDCVRQPHEIYVALNCEERRKKILEQLAELDAENKANAAPDQSVK